MMITAVRATLKSPCRLETSRAAIKSLAVVSSSLSMNSMLGKRVALSGFWQALA